MEHRLEVSTPALTAFLEGGCGLRRVDARRAVRLLADAGFFGARMVVDPELQPHRTLVAWRLVRAAASCLGLVAVDEPLEEALPQVDPSDRRTDIDPWEGSAPSHGGLAAANQSTVPRAAARAFVRLSAAEPALPLLPPAGPRALVERWIEAQSVLACAMGLDGTDVGRAGLAPLLDPDLVPLAGLCPDGVLAVEELLVDEATRLVVQAGESAAVDHFRLTYGFARGEARGLVRLARADALRGHSSTVEEDRALMVAQLKNYVGRARETMNMADELRAMRELARVQGLTRTDPEDVAADFVRVISAVSRRQEMLEAREVRLLPSGDDDLAEFEVDSLQERVIESRGP